MYLIEKDLKSVARGRKYRMPRWLKWVNRSTVILFLLSLIALGVWAGLDIEQNLAGLGNGILLAFLCALAGGFVEYFFENRLTKKAVEAFVTYYHTTGQLLQEGPGGFTEIPKGEGKHDQSS